MNNIVILSGSPSENSRTGHVLEYIGRLLEARSCSVTHLSVRDVPHEDLFLGRFYSRPVKSIVEHIENAHGVVVGSPVYKAAYSGVLKALIDFFPQDALEHTPVLPVMIGGSGSHLLAMEYTLKPLLANLKGQNLKGLYFLDNQVDRELARPIIDERLLERTRNQLDYFVDKAGHARHVLAAAGRRQVVLQEAV